MVIGYFRNGPMDGTRLLKEALPCFELAIEPGPSIPSDGLIKIERAVYDLAARSGDVAVYRYRETK